MDKTASVTEIIAAITKIIANRAEIIAIVTMIIANVVKITAKISLSDNPFNLKGLMRVTKRFVVTGITANATEISASARNYVFSVTNRIFWMTKNNSWMTKKNALVAKRIFFEREKRFFKAKPMEAVTEIIAYVTNPIFSVTNRLLFTTKKMFPATKFNFFGTPCCVLKPRKIENTPGGSAHIYSFADNSSKGISRLANSAAFLRRVGAGFSVTSASAFSPQSIGLNCQHLSAILKEITDAVHELGFAFLHSFTSTASTVTVLSALGTIGRLPGVEAVQVLRPRRTDEASDRV
jgi:hypothetical protein